MIIINTYDLVWRTTKRCQFHYRNQMHWYIDERWDQWDQTKEILINLTKLNKVTNANH